MPEELVEVYVAAGQAEANLVISYLEANGISVRALQEGAGGALGLNVGVLGEVRLWVKKSAAVQARALIREMARGSDSESETGPDVEET